MTPPNVAQQTVHPYKQFLLVLSVIYPLSLVVPGLLQSLPLPAEARGLLAATVIVGLMTYVIMPRYTRLVSAWLYR